MRKDSERGFVVRFSAALIFGALLASRALAQVPEASAVIDGSYTVTYEPNCGAAANSVYCLASDLQEKSGSNGSWLTVSSGTGSVTFHDKPEGTYFYRVYMVGMDYFGNYMEYVSPSLEVVVSGQRDDILSQMDYRYDVRHGDIDGDGKLDFLIKRTSGGAPANGVVDEVILKRVGTGGTFAASVPSVTQSSVASSWPRSPVQPVVHDINIDGYVDIALNGIAGVSANTPDQIVLSSGKPTNRQPLGVRAYDDDLVQFSENVIDYFVDRDYFIDNAPWYYYQIWSWYAYCPGFGYPGLDYGYWDLYSTCYIDYVYLTGVFADFSVFNEEAVSIWTNEQDAIDGYISPEDALDNIEEAVENVIDTPVGGWPMEELLGPSGIHKDPEFRKNIELVQAILGQIRGRNTGANPHKAPAQQPRQTDKIYYTGHHIFLWTNHMALEFTDSLGGASTATTISGFPERGLSPPHGKLWAELDRLSDQPHLNFTVGTLDVLDGVAPRTYWNNYLVPRHNRYVALPNANKVDYEPTPNPDNPNPQGINGYNSNSYVSGLPYSGALRNVPPSTALAFPGWSEPVPNQYFRQ